MVSGGGVSSWWHLGVGLALGGIWGRSRFLVVSGAGVGSWWHLGVG